MFGYYVQQSSPWHHINRTLRRPINYCIYLWCRLRVMSRERVSFMDVWTSSVQNKFIQGNCWWVFKITRDQRHVIKSYDHTLCNPWLLKRSVMEKVSTFKAEKSSLKPVIWWKEPCTPGRFMWDLWNSPKVSYQVTTHVGSSMYFVAYNVNSLWSVYLMRIVQKVVEKLAWNFSSFWNVWKNQRSHL